MNKILARPDQDLLDHLIEVSDYGRTQFDALRLNFLINEEDNETLIHIFKIAYEIIAFFHDLGKATEEFQNYIQNKPRDHYDSILKQHSRYSSLLCFIFFETLYSPNKSHFLNPDFLKKKIKTEEDGRIIKFPVIKIFKQIGVLSALIVRCHHSKQMFDLQIFFDEILNNNEIVENHQKRMKKTDFPYLFKVIEQEITLKFENFQDIVNLEKIRKEFPDFKKNYCNTLDTLLSDNERVRNGVIRPFIRESYKIKNCPVILNEIIFFMSKLLFSLLIDADKINAALGKNLISITNLEVSEFQHSLQLYLLQEKYYIPNEKFSFPFKDLNSRRRYILDRAINFKPNLSENSQVNPIIQLSVPTGFGKTFTSLYLATKLPLQFKTKNQSVIHPRIIYSLPFLSIIEQTEKVIDDFLSIQNKPTNIFLVHHHLTLPKYDDGENNNEYNESISHLLIEGWNSQYILSTFHQLFNACLKSNKYDSQRFNKIINCTWILDEIQSIPLNYWKMFSRIFKLMNKVFNTNIILMSATLPKILQNPDQSSITLFNTKERNQIIENINRISLEFHEMIEFSKFVELAEYVVSNKKNKSKNILIVLNTRKSAQELFRALSNNKDINKNRILKFLSASMIPTHKSLLISSIKNDLMNNRKNEGKPVLLISTQCIEAGVDVDFDLIIRDFAPLENIIQVAGRCNRNNSNAIGKVIIYPIYYNKTKGIRKKLSEYIYDGHKLKISYNLVYNTYIEPKASLPILYPEAEIDKLILKYYEKIDNFFKEGESVRFLKDYFEYISSFSFKSLSDSFNLIQNQAPYSFYIEIDNNAKKIFQEYSNILNSSQGKFDFEKYNKSLLIKKQIQAYIITAYIKKKDLNKINDLKKVGNLLYIPEEKLNDFYDNKIGFKI